MNQVLQRGQQIHNQMTVKAVLTHMHMNILILSLSQTHQRWFFKHIVVCIRTPWHTLNLSVHYPFHSAACEFVWRGRHLTLSCHPANILTHIASAASGSLVYREQPLECEELSFIHRIYYVSNFCILIPYDYTELLIAIKNENHHILKRLWSNILKCLYCICNVNEMKAKLYKSLPLYITYRDTKRFICYVSLSDTYIHPRLSLSLFFLLLSNSWI